jgi:ankyrin repeat protein
MSPLQFASYFGLLQHAQNLIEHGDLDAELFLFSRTPAPVPFEYTFRLMDYPAFPSIWWACLGGHQDIVKCLLDSFDFEKTTPSSKVLHEWKFNLLKVTLHMRRASVLDLLLGLRFVSLPAASNLGEALALFLLFDAACTSVALPYLDQEQMNLLLCIVAAQGDDGSVRTILAHPRANPNARAEGVTPLYLCCVGISRLYHCIGPSINCIRLLLDAGAHPERLSTHN